MRTEKKPKLQVFAIVRFDGGTDIENAITVTEIVPNATEAYREAERLNKLNGATGSRYFVQATRYYPEGRSGSKTLAKS